MSKKDKLAGGLNSVLGDFKEKRKAGRPKTQTKTVEKESERGTLENETRATFIVNKDLLGQVKSLAYWERLKIKEVVNQALSEHIKRYEKKQGALKPIPKN